MWRRQRLSLLVLITCLALAGTGCGWFGKKKKADRPPEVLVEEGFRKLKAGKYDKAVESFEQIRDRYPYSQEAMLAELKAADAKYFAKKYDEALQDYKNFEKLHPSHPPNPLCYLPTGALLLPAAQHHRPGPYLYPESPAGV